jgi:transposase
MELPSGVIELAELVVVFSLLLSQEYKSHVDTIWKLTTRSLLLLNFFDYRNGKFDELRNFLTRNPINITPTDYIDNYWEQWKETFLTAVKKYIPVRTVKDTNSPPWIDKEVRILIHKKYRALKNYRMNRSATRKRKLRSLTQQTKRHIRRKHQEYLAKIESSFSALSTQSCPGATIKLSYATVQICISASRNNVRRSYC